VVVEEYFERKFAKRFNIEEYFLTLLIKRREGKVDQKLTFQEETIPPYCDKRG